MSYVSALFHIVFCTRHRKNTIPLAEREQLFRFIWSLLQDNHCSLVRINGMENHLHMLINLSPTVSLSEVMRDLKSRTSSWLSQNPQFPKFDKWAKGYYAASVSYLDRDKVIEYIKGQQVHHNANNFDDELMALCSRAGLSYIEEDMC